MIRNWLWRRRGGLVDAQQAIEGPDSATSTPEPPPTSSEHRLHIVEWLFRLILGRAPDHQERLEGIRSTDLGQSIDALTVRLLASMEFRGLYETVIAGVAEASLVKRFEPALAALGSDEEFVAGTYEALLGRPADEAGAAFYRAHLERGGFRTAALKSFLRSDEFADRYRKVCPQTGFLPRDVQLCELANPAKWDNPEWLALLRSLQSVPPDKPSMHRKGYEFTQLLYGLTRLERLRPDVRILSVGAGHEPVLYWLANRVGLVVATDLYEGSWQAEGSMEGNTAVLTDPSSYAPFDYDKTRLVFLRMNGLALAFPDAAFDVVYSLSSVEHFAGLDGAKAAVAEMARVLRPGGILALATEYCLDGPAHHEAFQPDQIHDLLRNPGLRLLQPIDESVWRRYEYVPVDLRANPNQTPHMVVSDMGSVFTSVMAFLERVEKQ